MSLINTPLSPDQLKNLFHKLSHGKSIEVREYDEIIATKDLHSLFGNSEYFVIFYPAAKQNHATMGHFTCIIRNVNKKRIDFYDPLAYRPDEYKKFADRNLYYEQVNSLIKHLIVADARGWNVFYNEYQHQSRQHQIATCGRWCILRCLHKDLDNKKFNSFMKYMWKNLMKRKASKTMDVMVAQLIN
jgi:hypothetical protein